MAMAAVTTGTYAERRSRTDELRGRRPFARELLDFYGALLGVQEQAHELAISARPSARDLVAFVTEAVVPAVVDVSLVAGPTKLREAVVLRLESVDPGELVAAWVNGDGQALVVRFLARASVGPVLEALGPEAAASCEGVRDQLHCPGCGGPPQLSYFAVPSEDLASGGRFLLCARCCSSWGFARMTCPGCGEDTSSRLPIFTEERTASGGRRSV